MNNELSELEDSIRSLKINLESANSQSDLTVFVEQLNEYKNMIKKLMSEISSNNSNKDNLVSTK